MAGGTMARTPQAFSWVLLNDEMQGSARQAAKQQKRQQVLRQKSADDLRQRLLLNAQRKARLVWHLI